LKVKSREGPETKSWVRPEVVQSGQTYDKDRLAKLAASGHTIRLILNLEKDVILLFIGFVLL
jgi:hypothetical protein